MKVRFLTTITSFALLCLVNVAHAQTKKTNATPVKKTTSTQAKKNTSSAKVVTGSSAKTKTTTAVDSTSKIIKDTVAATKPIVAVASTQKTQVVQTAQHVTTPQATAQTVMPAASAPVFQNPFKKGTISFVNKENVDYTRVKESGLTTNTTSNLHFTAGVNYFFINNLAVGIDFTYNNLNSKPLTPSSYNYYAGYLNIIYGRAITPRLSVYGKISGGLGHSKSVSTQELVADYKDIYATIGAPIAVANEGSIFLTPYVTWDKFKTKAGIHDITETGFTFGVRMESYLNKNNTKKTNQPISPWPKKGASFIEYNTSASYGFSTRKEYQGNVRFGDVKKSNGTIGIGYHYYFLDFLAGGLNIYYNRYRADNGSIDLQKTFSIQPTVTANIPTESSLKYLFLQAGYEIGKANINGTKQDDRNVYLRLGYNLFLAKNISLSPKIGYQINKSTHHAASGGDLPYNKKGLAIELGVRAWLNTTNWFKK